MKKHLVNILKLLVSLGLGFGLILWFVNKMTPEEKQVTIDAIMRADYRWIMLAPVLGLISNFSRAQRWRLLLEPTGHKPGYWNTFYSVMMMYFFNLFFPRLGEVSRCGALARYENVPMDKSIGTMVIERLVDLVSILIIGGLLLFVEYDRLYNYFIVNVWNRPKPAETEPGMLKYVIMGAIIGLAGIGAAYIQRKYGFAKLKGMFRERLLGFWEGLKSIKNLKSPWEFLFHSVFIWVCYILMVTVSFPALEETAGLPFVASVACLFFGGFAMVLTPGGIGAYPLALQSMLLLYGVNATVGYAIGSVIWAAQMASVLVGGLICLILLAITNKEPALNSEPIKS